jgi:O-antigen/teichoic acid export membrane protein
MSMQGQGKRSIGGKAVRGVSYLTALAVAIHVVRLVKVAVLARLLSPEDFGILALAIVLYVSLQAFTSLGTWNYLVQKDHINGEIIGNAWAFQILRGIFICALLAAAAPYYSQSVDEPRSLPVIYILALVPFLEGFINPSKFLAERELRFGRVSVFEFSNVMVQTVMSIVLAYTLRDVRALAWGMVAGMLLSLVISFAMFRKPPLPRINPVLFRELLSVGKHFFIVALGAFIMTQGDKLLVGKFLGGSMLGVYVIAFRLCDIPIQILKRVVSRIAFPAFSRMQSERSRLASAFENVFALELAVLLPVAIFVFLLADPLVMTIYGEKWREAIPVVRALCLFLLSAGIVHSIAPLVMAKGFFSFASKAKVIETVVFIGSVYAGTYFYGMVGTAVGAGISGSVAACIYVWFLCKHGGPSFSRLLQKASRPILCVMPGIGVGFAILERWHLNPLAQLTLVMVLLGPIYIFLSYFLQRELVFRIKDNLSLFRP